MQGRDNVKLQTDSMQPSFIHGDLQNWASSQLGLGSPATPRFPLGLLSLLGWSLLMLLQQLCLRPIACREIQDIYLRFQNKQAIFTPLPTTWHLRRCSVMNYRHFGLPLPPPNSVPRSSRLGSQLLLSLRERPGSLLGSLAGCSHLRGATHLAACSLTALFLAGSDSLSRVLIRASSASLMLCCSSASATSFCDSSLALAAFSSANPCD